MRIEIDDPSLIEDLLSYLRDCQCELNTVRPHWVDATPPAAASDPPLAQLQLAGFLRTWKARHPQAAIRVVDRSASG
jgi:hypothetical protein